MIRGTFDAVMKLLLSRRRAYQLAFGSPAGEVVLDDLVVFCRGAQSTFHPDARMHAVLEGRREVLLRICQHMHLTPEKLFVIYGGQVPRAQVETDAGD